MKPSVTSLRHQPAADLHSGFYLDGIHVLPEEGLLQSPHGETRLEPRVMAVLLVLAGHAGKIVSREHLLDSVWADSVVTDDALARCIYRLRHELPRLLGSEHNQPVIETLRKRGFRLVLPVSASPSGPSAQPGARFDWRIWSILPIALLAIIAAGVWLLRPQPPGPDTPIRSIAVLPFANMTGEPAYAYLADGFSEQLSHALANVPGLKVAARTSAFYFKDHPAEIPAIAAQLNVKSLLEGSIRRHGGQLRVTVQLIHDDGFHLWSGEYDRPLTDILQLQSDIADQVVVELGLAESAAAAPLRNNPTENFAAYDLYIRGRYQMHQDQPQAYAEAIGLFRRAIELDPDYALAYTGVADAMSLQVSKGKASAEAVSHQIRTAIDRALELDPQLAEAHAARGLHLFVQQQYPEAEPHLRQAVMLNPNYVNALNWLGLDLVYQNRFAEAIDFYQRAQQLDPMDASLNRNLGANLLLFGRPEEGFSYLRRVQQLQPDQLLTYRMLAGWSLTYGRLSEALEWAASGLQRFPDDVRLLNWQGAANTQLGRWQHAQQQLQQAHQLDPLDTVVLSSLLYAHLASGDRAALDAVLRAQGQPGQPFGADPPFGKARIVLRWLLLQQLLNGDPARAIALADELATDENLSCSAFGEPGPRLYLAQALQLNGQAERSAELLQDCIADVADIRAQGGTYPRSLYRLALTLALAGDHTQAAEVLQQAVELGWRGYWYAWNDPLWDGLKDQAPYRAIFAGVAGELAQTD